LLQEKDQLRGELDKVKDYVRDLKEEQAAKFETYHKKASITEMDTEEKRRRLERECEKQQGELDGLRQEKQQLGLDLHEAQTKLEGYARDYERFFEENKRLRELLNQVRDDKDSAMSEV